MKKVNPLPTPNTDTPCDPQSIGLFIKAARTQQGFDHQGKLIRLKQG